MPAPVQTVSPSRNIPARTAEVRAYHLDESTPGKPLFLMIPSALVALASLIAIFYVLHEAYLKPHMAVQTANAWVAILLMPYFAGVFTFSYGYELYDVWKAARLTIIIGFIGLASIVLVVFLIALLKKSAKLAGGICDEVADTRFPELGSGAPGPHLTSLNIGPVVRPIMNLGVHTTGDVIDRKLAEFEARRDYQHGRCPRCDQFPDPARRVPEQTTLVPGQDFCPECRQMYAAGGWSANA